MRNDRIIRARWKHMLYNDDAIQERLLTISRVYHFVRSGSGSGIGGLHAKAACDRQRQATR